MVIVVAMTIIAVAWIVGGLKYAVKAIGESQIEYQQAFEAACSARVSAEQSSQQGPGPEAQALIAALERDAEAKRKKTVVFATAAIIVSLAIGGVATGFPLYFAMRFAWYGF